MGNAADSYRRFLNGDDDGLYEIIKEFNTGLLLYVNHIVSNISATEEIVQNTFVKLAVKKPKFKGKSSFKTWLYAIARNQAIDFLRRKSRFSQLSFDEYYILTDKTDVETQYLKEEQKIELLNAMKNLNPNYRQVICLMYLEGFSTEETAKIMHKTKRQIGDLIYRAKKSLKNQLEKEGFIYERF